MAKNVISQHKLLTIGNYSRQGKLKRILTGWIFYLLVLIVTQIPPVQVFLIDFAERVQVGWVIDAVNFLIKGWPYIAIVFVIGTFIECRKKQNFDQLKIYDTGISFVHSGTAGEQYVDYGSIQISPGKMGQSFFIVAKSADVDSEYAWQEFEHADVLENNLKRYSSLS